MILVTIVMLGMISTSVCEAVVVMVVATFESDKFSSLSVAYPRMQEEEWNTTVVVAMMSSRVTGMILVTSVMLRMTSVVVLEAVKKNVVDAYESDSFSSLMVDDEHMIFLIRYYYTYMVGGNGVTVTLDRAVVNSVRLVFPMRGVRKKQRRMCMQNERETVISLMNDFHLVYWYHDRVTVGDHRQIQVECMMRVTHPVKSVSSLCDERYDYEYFRQCDGKSNARLLISKDTAVWVSCESDNKLKKLQKVSMDTDSCMDAMMNVEQMHVCVCCYVFLLGIKQKVYLFLVTASVIDVSHRVDVSSERVTVVSILVDEVSVIVTADECSRVRQCQSKWIDFSYETVRYKLVRSDERRFD